MTEFKIDKGIPIPETTTGTKYPFSAMAVGDSFFAPGRTSRQLQNVTSTYRKRGMKFKAVQQEENGVKGTRIWRIE